MLYPKDSESREVKELNGLWSFKVDKNSEGYVQKWYEDRLEDAILMPVPASYNDITVDASTRDHIGDVWYERIFYVSSFWHGRRLVLRVGSATHHAAMWVNGRIVASHKGGFLPFEAEVTDLVCYGAENRLTLCVNNVLDWSCLPSGEVKTFDEKLYPKGFKVQDTYFDFYNYSGIHRPVKLYTTPKTYIDDISVTTDISGTDGVIEYHVTVNGEELPVKLTLTDTSGRVAAEGKGLSGSLMVKDAKLWRPGSAYLYDLKVEMTDAFGGCADSYHLPVGIRTVKLDGNRFLINGEPFYFKGFGKHEDSDIRGKGLDEALNVKDFNLLKWIGANSFRTSHYPYSEEIMDLADREGIVIIDEVPAVGMCFWSETNTVFRNDRVNEETLAHHLQTIRDLIARDGNHPCVVMWSVANEAATNEEAAVPYFTAVVEEARKQDDTRLVTIVQTMWPSVDKVSQLVDVICINKYFGWYADHGQIGIVEMQMDRELRDWYGKYKKPVIVSEFGADAIAGFHQLPAVSFSEEFQCDFLKRYFQSFDKHDFVIGEHVWAFADFATKQGLTRVMGNRKGVFTRQRQPKAAAFILKERWDKIK